MCYIPKPKGMEDKEWDAIWAAWNSEFNEKRTAQDNAIKALGYTTKYGTDKERGPFLGPDGFTYLTSDEYYKSLGKMPAFIKDGVWYGWWEIIVKHNLEFEMTSVCPVNVTDWGL